MRGDQGVPLESISGGEKLLVGCAFLYAINVARKPATPMIFVESAELDQENSSKLLDGLRLAASEGIQCFMTSFSEVNGECIFVGMESAAA